MAQEKWLIEDPKIIDLENVHKLKVSLLGGKVDLVGHDEPGTRVEVHSVSGKPLKISFDDGVLEIDHPQLGWDRLVDSLKSFRGGAKADVSIMVPRQIAVSLGVVGASALISGLTTDATVSTVSGDVVADGLTGDLQLNGVSGEIAVRAHTGKISARTVSGDITASGDIRVFSGDSVSGDVLTDVTGIPDEIRVNTVSGSVTTRLAHGVPAQYRINTVGGKLQLDNALISGIRGNYTSKYGSLEKHWLDFKANTVSGNINVIHEVSA
ncbi:MAG: hypothetical protein JWM51_1533 [Microbacteriaceae bacterium]|nr:hypothetical protein [Microbacteriaceae bacterium]